MNKIQVKVLNEHGIAPGKMMVFLAKLTQRGHKIKNMDDLVSLYNKTCPTDHTIERIADLPHGTIKRFTPITIAVVGASRRFLSQIRTHSIGLDFVSASLQYSDYTGKGSFVVPYEILGTDHEWFYNRECTNAMDSYKKLIDLGVTNDTAGYVAPQGLRNILVMQGNHESWANVIRARACNRNTVESQYVIIKIWEALLQTFDGPKMFANVGPDCMYGKCREGVMTCGSPFDELSPYEIIKGKWGKL